MHKPNDLVEADVLDELDWDPRLDDTRIIAERIQKAFRRNAIIDDSRIEVWNDGPTIYLDGVVGSWKAKTDAVDTAWSAPGVQQVIDRTTVMP
jgi:osmotically-inducible protein OsmY